MNKKRITMPLLTFAVMAVMLFAMTITASAASTDGVKQTGSGTTYVNIE